MQRSELFERYQQAQALLAEGELQQAAELCQTILNADLKFAHGYQLMSSLFRTTGDFDRALELIERALALQPREALFHFQKGQLLFALGRFAPSVESLSAAHALDPTHTLTVLLLADGYAQLSQFDEAERLFRRARAMQDLPEIDEHEGLCLLMKGDLATAELMFDRVIARQPDYAGGYAHKGRVLLFRKHYDRAEPLFEKALSLNPQTVEAQHGLALIHESRAGNAA